MFKSVIKQYINIISVNDVIMFATKENIKISNQEATIILNYIKKNWEEIIYGNDLNAKNFLNQNFDITRSQEIYKLLQEYKKKYRNYL